jgi:hypothetical protein
LEPSGENFMECKARAGVPRSSDGARQSNNSYSYRIWLIVDQLRSGGVFLAVVLIEYCSGGRLKASYIQLGRLSVSQCFLSS